LTGRQTADTWSPCRPCQAACPKATRGNRENIRKASDLYIKDCIAAGDEVPTEAGREYVGLTTGISQ
jgi:hypothetical protein